MTTGQSTLAIADFVLIAHPAFGMSHAFHFLNWIDSILQREKASLATVCYYNPCV
jgi:hypothetical protein